MDVLTELGVWVSSDRQHPLAAPDPLDELSFIYYVRGLNLNAAARSERHFDPARSPVQFQLIGQEKVTALGAEHDATVIRMEVKDPRQKTGQGTLRFYIGADAARLPLRIDSSMPMAGALTLTLQSVTVNERVAIVNPRGKRAQQ